MKLFLDASAISDHDRCKEFYRLGHMPQTILGEFYPDGIDEIAESIHYRFGTGAHTFVEAFWSGITNQNDLTDIWFLVCQGGPCKCGSKPGCFICEGKGLVEGLDVRYLNPDAAEKWRRLLGAIPDMVARYLESVAYEPDKLVWLEKEWQYPYQVSGEGNSREGGGSGMKNESIHPPLEVILCGRIDRVMAGPSLVDVKTASEIGGAKWKANYREEKLLEVQFGLYDWFLQRMCKCGHPNYDHEYLCHKCEDCYSFESMAPKEVRLEVMIKPYPCTVHKEGGAQENCDTKKGKCKMARIGNVYLNEIITESYRKRFEQQLAFKVEEIVRYHREYSEQKPWPMNASQCVTKFGQCEFGSICRHGESVKTMGPFKKRESHLQLVRLG